MLKDVDIEKVLVSNKISSGETNSKYFIGYMYNDHKVKSLHIMILKTSTYVKRYDWKWWLIRKMQKKKKILIESLSIMKTFWKPK